MAEADKNKKRNRSDTSSTSSISSLSEWDKSLDKLVDDINKTKQSKKKKPKIQSTPEKSSKTEIETIQEETMSKGKTTDQRLDEMNKKLSNMITRDDKAIFREIIKETFEEMKTKLLEPIMKRLEILEGDLHSKNIENDNLKTEVINMKQRIEEQNEEIQTIINQKDNEIKKVKADLMSEVDEQKEALNELDQYGRRNSFRISGLRHDKPFISSQETAWQVVTFLNERMGLDLSVHQIDIAHRLGHFRRDRNRNIIVKLISRQVKYNIFARVDALRNTGVYINEDLTHLNQQVLSSMRLKDKINVEKAWSFEGKLFVKRKGKPKHEEVTYKNYEEWLELPWPEERTTP